MTLSATTTRSTSRPKSRLISSLEKNRFSTSHSLSRNRGGAELSFDLVECRSLRGREAGVANQRRDLVDAGAAVETGLLHHILVEDGAAEVVAAKVQRHHARLLPFRKPRRLHVHEVVQIDSRQRHDAQVAIGSGLHGDMTRERVLVALVAPGHERGKAVRLVL